MLAWSPLPAVAGSGDAPVEAEPAVSLAAVYTGEAWRELAGGVARGSAYIDNLDLQLKLDGARRGWPGVSAYLYLLYDNGQVFAAPYTGSLQGVSNIEAVPASRLYEAWMQVPAPGGGSLRFGLYNLNTEFDVNEVGAMFIGPAHGIGSEFAHTGVSGPSIFPVTGLALRYQRPFAAWRTRVALIDGVPGDPADPRRTYVHLGGNDGVLLVGELGRAMGGLDAYVGVWHYSLRLPDLRDTDAGGNPILRRGSSGAYALVSGSLWGNVDTGRDLAAFLRVGVADARVYQTHLYCGAGVVGTGLFAGRPVDRLGIALAVATNGAAYRDAQAAAGAPANAAETDLELSYRAVLGDHLFVQPDLHYVIDPGTDPTLANAWALGLRFQAAAWWAR